MILITGGAGYIASHTIVELQCSGYEVLALDNLSNSSPLSLEKVAEITGIKPDFIEGDIRDKALLQNVFKNYKIEAVIHFAGLKAVGVSNSMPIEYYQNNVAGTLTLCEVMANFDCKKIVFSSSATVYGEPASVPIDESFPLFATNPYGRSKLIIEEMLRDLSASDSFIESSNPWSISLLRYFNPVGAHESGLIGEDPRGIPNNLMPYISQVASGQLAELGVFGNDYNTSDGTGVRDYIHVVDLAKGHVKALDRLLKNLGIGCTPYNLGTGKGVSVLEAVSAFEQANDVKIPYCIKARRAGDIAECYADAQRAKTDLGWKAEKTLEDMVSSAWNWQKNNPKGYQ